jgi:nicotinamide-nucleotide amidase
MRVELLATGDEILSGAVTDTNSPYLLERLFTLGLRVQRTTLVGDVRGDIEDALVSAAARADVVVVSGGLGPTADDLTVECVARVLGVRVVEDAGVLAALQERMSKGVVRTANNLRQALVPEGAEVVKNPVGSAPMLVATRGHCTFFVLPGVPREFRQLVDGEVVPRLQARLNAEPGRLFHAARLLKTVGMPESHLDAAVAPITQRFPEVIFGFRALAPECHLKLLATAPSQVEADERLARVESECRAALGSAVFGHDGDTLASVVGGLLSARGHTVTLAESCTGGRGADLLCEVPGASRYFLGSAVSYANALKEEWVGVKADTLARVGAVSAEVAAEMAEGARARTGATWGASVTGIAGPGGGSDEKPVGTVFFGLSGPAGVRTEKRFFHGDRERIRQSSAYTLLDGVRRALLGEKS